MADLNGSTVVARYVRGMGLILSDSSAGQKFYLFDGHGDVVQLAGSSGTILWKYDYDAYGNEREIAGQDPSLDANPFRYCGEYFDKETGSIYLRARYYSPVTGRFYSEDPIRSGLTWYVYCSNNPVIFIDPSGLVEVGLRAYAATYAGSVVGWDDKTKTATVTWNGLTLSVQSTSQNNRNGSIYVDDLLFINAFGNGSDAITVYHDVATNNVSIRTNFYFTGDTSTKLDSTLYKDLFITGVWKYWNDTFGKYEVSTYALESTNGIRVNIIDKPGVSNVKNGSFWWSKSNGTVTMHTSYPGYPDYTTDEFEWVSAHEMGHILGVYNNQDILKYPYDIMATSWDTKYGPTAITIETIIKAWNSGKRKVYPK